MFKVLTVIAVLILNCSIVAAQDGYDYAKSFPLFEVDPVVTEDPSITSYITPAMVHINQGGECAVANVEGFFEAEPMAFFIGPDGYEYPKILVYPHENFTGGDWKSFEELDIWVRDLCNQKSLTS
jgi:hypothetical protein